MLVSCVCIRVHPVRASPSSFLSVPSSCKMETTASSSMVSTETGGSEFAERFTIRKFGESAEAWSDRTNWPEGMLNVPVRAEVHHFLFGDFNFNNEEIDNSISSFDDESKELIIFGRRVWFESTSKHVEKNITLLLYYSLYYSYFSRIVRMPIFYSIIYSYFLIFNKYT